MKPIPRPPLMRKPETDDEYVVRCLERYIDEIRRRLATRDVALIRIGVKVEDGRVISVKAHSEDDLVRLGDD